MNITKFTLQSMAVCAFALILGLVFTMSSYAEEKGKKGKRPHLKKEMLERFDKNQDGKLDEEEKAEMRKAMEERRQEALKKFDKDGDGKLNEEERAAAKEEMKKKKAELKEKKETSTPPTE